MAFSTNGRAQPRRSWRANKYRRRSISKGDQRKSTRHSPGTHGAPDTIRTCDLCLRSPAHPNSHPKCPWLGRCPCSLVRGFKGGPARSCGADPWKALDSPNGRNRLNLLRIVFWGADMQSRRLFNWWFRILASGRLYGKFLDWRQSRKIAKIP